MTAPRPLGTPVPWEGGSASLTRGRRARAQAAARALLPVPVAAARAVAAEPRGGGRPAQAAQGVLQALRRGGQRAAGRGGLRHNCPQNNRLRANNVAYMGGLCCGSCRRHPAWSCRCVHCSAHGCGVSGGARAAAAPGRHLRCSCARTAAALLAALHLVAARIHAWP